MSFYLQFTTLLQSSHLHILLPLHSSSSFCTGNFKTLLPSTLNLHFPQSSSFSWQDNCCQLVAQTATHPFLFLILDVLHSSVKIHLFHPQIDHKAYHVSRLHSHCSVYSWIITVVYSAFLLESEVCGRQRGSIFLFKRFIGF